MSGSVTIAYLCPKCGAKHAVLPPKSETAGTVRCSQCGRAHGSLDEVQKEIATKAREEGAQRVRQVYRVRPTKKYGNSARERLKRPDA